MMSAFMCVDPTTTHGHDIFVDACLDYNSITRISIPLGFKQCITKNSKLPSLVRAGQCALSLLNVVSLAIRFRNTASRAHFVIADRLAVSLLVETRFLKSLLKTIVFERDALVFNCGIAVSVLT